MFGTISIEIAVAENSIIELSDDRKYDLWIPLSCRILSTLKRLQILVLYKHEQGIVALLRPK